MIVFTTIDETLLNRAAIERLRAAGIPVIPVSEMTLDELAPIADDLEFRQAMVIEAGGAIARWKDGSWAVEPCGPSAESFLDVVKEIEDRTGASLLVCSATEEEMLHSSARRCFSEPFLIECGDLKAIEHAAAEIGFSVRRGRQCFYLCRKGEEGEAFLRLRAELPCDVAIAAGSSPLDAEFLARADVAIVVPGADGTVDPELLAKVPTARIAPLPGPAGWAVAVEEAVTARSLPMA